MDDFVRLTVTCNVQVADMLGHSLITVSQKIVSTYTSVMEASEFSISLTGYADIHVTQRVEVIYFHSSIIRSKNMGQYKRYNIED